MPRKGSACRLRLWDIRHCWSKRGVYVTLEPLIAGRYVNSRENRTILTIWYGIFAYRGLVGTNESEPDSGSVTDSSAARCMVEGDIVSEKW